VGSANGRAAQPDFRGIHQPLPEVALSLSERMHEVSREDEPRSPSPFVCSWTKAGRQAAWVRVAGTVDRLTVAELERGLEEAQGEARLVVLDLRQLTRIDPGGARAILASSLRARDADCRLILVRGPEQVDRVFSMTGVSGELEIHDLDPSA
jgi:anti-anti-sigma factor